MDAPRRFPFVFVTKLRPWSAVLLALLAYVCTATARDDADNPFRPDDLTPAEIAEPEAAEKPWQETVVVLPPFPRAEDLLPIRAETGGTGYKYYIDVNSVTLTPNEVLRYTIVIQTPEGASNIVYEGIRCATSEIRTLAYGTRDGRFRRMEEAPWTYVHTQGPMGYRTTLVERYVCDENGWAVDSDTVLERLVMHDPRRTRVAPKEAPSSD
jgi:hypothetical protein